MGSTIANYRRSLSAIGRISNKRLMKEESNRARLGIHAERIRKRSNLYSPPRQDERVRGRASPMTLDLSLLFFLFPPPYSLASTFSTSFVLRAYIRQSSSLSLSLSYMAHAKQLLVSPPFFSGSRESRCPSFHVIFLGIANTISTYAVAD